MNAKTKTVTLMGGPLDGLEVDAFGCHCVIVPHLDKRHFYTIDPEDASKMIWKGHYIEGDSIK